MLGDQGFESRQGQDIYFFSKLLCGANPASYSVALFFGFKAARLTIHVHSEPRLRMSGALSPLHLHACMTCVGTRFFFALFTAAAYSGYSVHHCSNWPYSHRLFSNFCAHKAHLLPFVFPVSHCAIYDIALVVNFVKAVPSERSFERTTPGNIWGSFRQRSCQWSRSLLGPDTVLEEYSPRDTASHPRRLKSLRKTMFRMCETCCLL